MGILEELGLTEEDLNPFKHPPSVLGESIPESALADDAPTVALSPDAESPTQQSLVSLVQPEEDDWIQQLRDQKIELPGDSPAGGQEQPKKPKPKSKGKRVAYSVRCTLNLCGSDYSVELLPAKSDYDKAYRLTKIDAAKPTGYNVVQVEGEILCECYDFRYRQDSAAGSKGCKHVRGLVDLGFFAAPSPSDRIRSRIFD